MKTFGRFFLAVGLCLVLVGAAEARRTTKVLLIPLDDRPPCLQFPVRMGHVGDAEIVTPPRALLGRFTEFGKSDEIIAWMRSQNLRSFDAAIVSMDMLAFGGLVASRVGVSGSTEQAMKRIAFIREMKRLAPKLPIYGSSVIMRLAPSADGTNEHYRVNLARWAEISSETSDPKLVAETAELEKKIPAEALADYKRSRARNLEINLEAVNLVRNGVFDYLILSQDDAKPRGVHIADREKLIATVKEKKLEDRVAVQPGADEVSMLLISRAMTSKFKYSPRIKAVYSSEEIANQFMPYEDRPLRKTVSFHIIAAGGKEVTEMKDADIVYYVFSSRFERGRAESFAEEISKHLIANPAARVIVGDVDPKGEIQGADIAFTEALRSKGVFSKLAGYASWNTAGNTIGTALPHGVLYSLSQARFKDAARLRRVDYAQAWFILNRLMDDYIYHSVVRPESIAFGRSKGWNVFRFTDEQSKVVEEFTTPKVGARLDDYRKTVENLRSGRLTCTEAKDYRFTLPWGRTFEGEVEFELNCKNR